MPRGPFNWRRRDRIEPVPARGAGPGSLSHPAGITARIINCCTSLAPWGCRHGVLGGCSWLLTTLPILSCLAEPGRELNPRQGSGAVLTICALPSLPALLPVLVILPNGGDLIFPFFFPFLILCSIPALPQHHWVPASTRSRSLLSSSPGGLAGCSHLLPVLEVPSEGSICGTSLPTPFTEGFTASVFLSLGGSKNLKIHPACGDTTGTPCPSKLGTAGVAGAAPRPPCSC